MRVWVIQNQKTRDVALDDNGAPLVFNTCGFAAGEALDMEDGDDWRPMVATLTVKSAGGGRDE